MPGAYARQPQGEHYQLLCQSVTAFKEKPSTASFANLLLLQGQREKKDIEEFIAAGGFEAEFEVLKSRREPQLVRLILENWLTLMAVLHDPYDDDIPPLPLLTYFLCQRNDYYVDIHWCHSELTFMAEFSLALFAVISDIKLPDDLRLICIGILRDVLATFPPHRVSEAAAGVFSTQNCRVLVRAAEDLCFQSDNTAQVWVPKLAAFLVHVLAFGLGTTIAASLPMAQLLHSTVSLLLPGFRCTCNRCEFIRKLKKTTVCQDEFGIAAATEFKKEICFNLIKAGALRLALKILDFIIKQPISADSVLRTEPYDRSKDPACCYFGTIDETNDDPGDGSFHYVCIFLAYCQTMIVAHHGDSSLILLGPEGSQLTEKLINVIIHRMDSSAGLNIILNQTTITASCLLSILWLGMAEFLRLDRTDKLLGKQAEELYITMIRPASVTVIETVCKRILEENTWNPYYVHGIKLILSSLYLLLSHQQPGATRKDPCTIGLPESTIQLIINVCSKVRDEWKKNEVAMDARCACLCILAICTYLVDGVALAQCRTSIKRKFLAAPKPITGRLTDIARDMLKRFTEDIVLREETAGSCLTIKALATIVISRSEQASAIVPVLDRDNKPLDAALKVKTKLAGRNTFATTA